MERRPVFHPDLGRYFAELRKAHGWKQSQAAHFAARRGLAALTRQVLLRLENGKTKNPEPDVLRAVGDLYGVPYEQLVTRCVEAQYGVELRPARPGEARPAAWGQPGLAAGDEDELRLLERYRQISPRHREVLDALLTTMEAQAAGRTRRARAR